MTTDKYSTLTAERLRELLHYDPQTGSFTWIKKFCGKVVVGGQAGNWHIAGYLRIRIDGHSYKGHRLAWLYIHGVWPSGVIDHKNRCNSDNRIENLRDSTQKQNMENRRGNHVTHSGILGVYWQPQNKNWRAQIVHNGEQIHIGSFQTKEEAHSARIDAERKYFTHSPACEQ